MEFVNKNELVEHGKINCVDTLDCVRRDVKQSWFQRMIGATKTHYWDITAVIGVAGIEKAAGSLELQSGDRILCMDLCLDFTVTKVIEHGWRKYAVVSVGETGFDMKAHELLGQEFEVRRASVLKENSIFTEPTKPSDATK